MDENVEYCMDWDLCEFRPVAVNPAQRHVQRVMEVCPTLDDKTLHEETHKKLCMKQFIQNSA